MEAPRPTRQQLQAAYGRRIPDLIAPGLRVLFCGINPGLYSAALGHHFARPGNRFWRALHEADFSHRLLAPWEAGLLLERRIGITDLVPRATAGAHELTAPELIAGRHRLARKAEVYTPQWVAILGLGAYRTAFARPQAGPGPQPERLGPSRLWVLPNPSGLNASYSLARLVRAFRELRRAAGLIPGA
jgi:TDG/mug DNA glycosylase family protein